MCFNARQSKKNLENRKAKAFKSGLKQGDLLSPILFNLALQKLILMPKR